MTFFGVTSVDLVSMWFPEFSSARRWADRTSRFHPQDVQVRSMGLDVGDVDAILAALNGGIETRLIERWRNGELVKEEQICQTG